MMESSPGGALFTIFIAMGLSSPRDINSWSWATHFQHQYRALRLIELAHPMLNCADGYS
ncbi:hypothetical protein [Bradyrhizobium sp. 30]|uniref:hypothetical protein n=1 Tax=Bradyrhizobium sp. 30 TaxID=2782669 RepID=UPI001FFB6F64|nr:hypothetical protein [Bradyrhizobium sp. 30]MCK1293511.1 hypothetical protein [Bradyrhizobium sp. 30]